MAQGKGETGRVPIADCRLLSAERLAQVKGEAGRGNREGRMPENR